MKVFLKSSLRDLYVGLSICMHTQSFRKKISPILIPSSGHYVSVQSLFQCPVITSVSSPYIIHTVITSVSSHYVSIQSLHTVITSVSSPYIVKTSVSSVQSLRQCPVTTSSHYVSVQSPLPCGLVWSSYHNTNSGYKGGAVRKTLSQQNSDTPYYHNYNI